MTNLRRHRRSTILRPLQCVLTATLCGLASGQSSKPIPVPPQDGAHKTAWEAPDEVAELLPLALEPRGTRSGETQRVEHPKALLEAHPRPERLYFDEPGDGSLWVRGTTFKARFSADRVSYIPYFGSTAPRNFPITFQAPVFSIGGVVQAHTAPEVAGATRSGDSVALARGLAVERYDLQPASMEQLFVLAARPEPGELTIRIAVETELAVSTTPEGGLRFSNELGHVDYSRAVAIDANGTRLPLETAWNDSAIELRVPDELLSSAAYPLTIDPILNTFALDFSEATTFNSDLAYDATNECYLMLYEVVFSSTDHDVFAELRNADGIDLNASTWIDLTLANWAGPHVANNNIANNFLVAAQVGQAGSRVVYGRIRDAGSTTMGAPFSIPFDIVRESYNVDVGGDPSLEGPTYYCVVWEREWVEGADHDIIGQLIDANGQPFGLNFAIDTSFGTLDRFPRISNSNGGPPHDTQNWNIVFSRDVGGVQNDVFGAQVRWDGLLTSPSVPLITSSANDIRPAASSPLDDNGSAARDWMLTFERVLQGPNMIVGVMTRGTSPLGAYLLATQADAGENQRMPDVDSDGRMFCAVWSQQYEDSPEDYDSIAATFAWHGSTLSPVEAELLLSGSGADEHDPAITTAHAAGGPRRRVGSTWTHLAVGGDYEIGAGIIDMADPPVGEVECTSVVNSTNQRSRIQGFGTPFLSEQSLQLVSTGNPANAPGLFFFGTAQVQVPFGDGFRCVGGVVRRMAPIAATDAAGEASRAVNFSAGYASSIVPGSLFFQYWFRDGAAGLSGFNLSDAFRMNLLP